MPGRRRPMTVQAKKLLNLTHVARLTHHEPRRHSIDAALTELTIKKIIRGFKTDPDIAYVTKVAETILDDLEKRAAITHEESEELIRAVQRAARDAAQFVAQKWLSERESTSSH